MLKLATGFIIAARPAGVSFNPWDRGLRRFLLLGRLGRRTGVLALGSSVALDEVPGFAERSVVPPGLTGIAQIYAARDISRRQKFRFDRLYVKRRSFLLDLKLLSVSFWITMRGTWESRERKF